MERTNIIYALKQLKENSVKRNFKQSVDIVINLKDLDLKNPTHQVNTFIQLPHLRGRNMKVCALVGPELMEQAKTTCDLAISSDDFDKYAQKGKAKRLAQDYDFFIAQATMMTKIATLFGRIFGPRGKMPNPKAGCVVPPNANLKPVFDKLQKTIKLATKNDPIIHCSVGKEDMNDEEIADNIMAIYNTLLHTLPNEQHNIKNLYVKTTMGKAVRVSEQIKEVKQKDKKKK